MNHKSKLTPEQLERYDQAAEIMASWALDDMYPDEFATGLIWRWILGEITVEEFAKLSRQRHGVD